MGRWILAILLALWAGSAWAGITPAITPSRCDTGPETCVTPLAVFFSARSTTCSAPSTECDNNPISNEAFHALRYKWTFGDPAGGATWATSGQSKNIEYGPLAAHVYETSGSFTVTLEVWSDTEYSSTTTVIYVDDADTEFASNTLCVANGSTPTPGSGGCPSGAYAQDASDFDNIIETALSGGCGGSGCRRILFKAGDTFTFNNQVLIDVDGPGTIGSYGTANNGRAIVDGVSTCTTDSSACDVMFPWEGGDTGSTDDWRFLDLDVRLYTPMNPISAYIDHPTFIYYDWSNGFDDLLVQNLLQLSGRSVILTWRAGAYRPDASHGIFIVESHVTGSLYGLAVSTIGGAVMGNTVGDASLDCLAHLFRASDGRWEDELLAHNDFVCCTDLDTTIRGSNYVQVPNSQFMVVRENYFARAVGGGGSNWAPVTIRPSNPSLDQRAADIIVENNRFDTSLHISQKRVTVRNNVFSTEDGAAWGAPIWLNNNNNNAIPAGHFDEPMIYNNSGYSDRDGETMIYSQDAAGDSTRMPTTAWIQNNAYWNDDSGAEVYYCDTTPGYCDGFTHTNNIDRTDTANTPFATTPADVETISDWYLTGAGAAAAIDQGTDLGTWGVYDDFQHTARPVAASYDIGAIEGTGAGATCGNGVLEGAEECDDSNLVDGDGCDSSCLEEAGWTCSGEPSVCTGICGDSLIVWTERCDDGGTTPGDGCDSSCQVDRGWVCSGEPSVCVTRWSLRPTNERGTVSTVGGTGHGSGF